jgi:hypothetical protein
VLVATAHAFVINRPLAALFAFLALAIPLALLRALATTGPKPGDTLAQRRRRGLGGLVIGYDGRASTSKTQAVLWTFAVFYGIAFMLLWGRSVGCGDADKHDGPRCQAAADRRAAFDDFTNRGLQPQYFVLLGFPITVAIAAKAITTSQVEEGAIAKQTLTEDEGEGGLRQGIRELASNDNGETDLVDFQYLSFGALTLAFFFIEFSTHPGNGFPDLPPTLVALSGVSAAGYTTKKALAGITGRAKNDAPATAPAVGAVAAPPPPTPTPTKSAATRKRPGR